MHSPKCKIRSWKLHKINRCQIISRLYYFSGETGVQMEPQPEKCNRKRRHRWICNRSRFVTNRLAWTERFRFRFCISSVSRRILKQFHIIVETGRRKFCMCGFWFLNLERAIVSSEFSKLKSQLITQHLFVIKGCMQFVLPNRASFIPEMP